MPTAAYTCRRHLPAVKNLLGSFSNSFVTLKSMLLSSKHNTMRTESNTEMTHPEPNDLRSTDKKYAQYYSLVHMNTIDSTVESHKGDSSRGNDVSLRLKE